MFYLVYLIFVFEIWNTEYQVLSILPSYICFNAEQQTSEHLALFHVFGMTRSFWDSMIRDQLLPKQTSYPDR